MYESSDKADADGIYHDEVAQRVLSLNVDDVTRTKRLLRQIDARIPTLFAWIYLLNYLNRGNIGNARILKSQTNDSLAQVTHLTGNRYAIVVSLFSLAYMLFEVPSNIIMKRYVPPHIWIAVLLFCWSAFTLGFAGATTFPQTAILRFFIGMFEAGFLPGIVYVFTFWYRPEERSLRIALVNSFAILAGAFGGCIAYGMGKINGAGGLQGFRWLFLLEGTISLLSRALVYFGLNDHPEKSWLKGDDAKFAAKRLQGMGFTRGPATREEIRATCISPRMLAHYVMYLFNCVPLGSLTFYTPTLVNGLGYASINAQLLTVPPWITGFVISLTLSYFADKYNARGWGIAVSSTIGGIGWLAAGLLPVDAYQQRYGALILCACGAFPCASPLTAWVSCITPAIATVGIAAAINNSTAGLSQIIAQWIWISKEAKQ